MRILYVTDLHGDKAKYEEVLKIALLEDIKIIVNGGDMLPNHGDALTQLHFIKYSLRNYFDLLKKMGITYLCMLGNDDLMSFEKYFDDLCTEYKNIFNIAQNIVSINGYNFIGMNYILDTPFSLKDRVVNEKDFICEKQLRDYAVISNGLDFDYIDDWNNYSRDHLKNMKDILNSLPVSNNLSKTVYVMHMPPADLRLGRIYSQDKDIGSKEIYEFIKEKQPILSLHGHIHEAPDVDKGTWINNIGATTCINPGQTKFGNGELTYSIIDLEKRLYLRKKQEIKANNKHFI